MFQRKLSLLKPAALFYLLVVAFNFVNMCSYYAWAHFLDENSVVPYVNGLIIGT